MKDDPYFAFASDNCAGICPAAWEAMEAANRGYAPSYGDDCWTDAAAERLREIFEYPCDVYFTFNGTAANALSIAALCRSYHSVIAHRSAHVETDECGGPEFFTHGTKLLLVDGADGRISPDEIDEVVGRRTDIHYPKPRAVSITQPTEFGTVYSVEHLAGIHEACLRHDLRIHMDGARFASAVTSLNVQPKDITWKLGVDVLCLGGTKGGMAAGECVVFFNRDASEEFAYRCKQAGQLASKMRFLAAPWVGMLNEQHWLKLARQANDAARRLADRIQQVPGVSLAYPVQANSVFVNLPRPLADQMKQRGWHFYDFIGGASRLMCSWQTSDAEIDCFVADLEQSAVLQTSSPAAKEA